MIPILRPSKPETLEHEKMMRYFMVILIASIIISAVIEIAKSLKPPKFDADFIEPRERSIAIPNDATVVILRRNEA